MKSKHGTRDFGIGGALIVALIGMGIAVAVALFSA